MRNLSLALVCALGLAAAPAAHAQAFQNVSIAARAGSLGAGLELTTSITPKFNLRLAGHFLGYSRTDEISDFEILVETDSELNFASGALFADYFPARRGFRATAGLVLNQNKATIEVTPLENYTLNDRAFTPSQIGTLSADLGYKSAISPYVGIGFGNSVLPEAKLGFVFDLGVLYTGPPKVEMSGTGMIAPTAEQGPEVEEIFKDVRLWPLVSLGLSYKI